MSEKDHANILAIIDAGDKILRFTQDFVDADGLYADERSFDAVLMNVVVIGETVSKLSKDILSGNPQVPWQKIKGLRNIVAHDYFGVDAEEIWEIVQKHIPKLIFDLNTILNKQSG
jgi:uncharacterized protein with HEPN domain